MNSRQRKAARDGGAILSSPEDGTEWCYGYDRDAVIVGYFVKCRKHPWYKAIRAPREDCSSCKLMFAERRKS